MGNAIPANISLSWKKLEPSTYPKPRAGHIGVTIHSNLFIFGGSIWESDEPDEPPNQTNELWVYDTALNEWKQPHMKGSIPSPRTGATASVVGGSTIVVFGGLDIEKGWLNEVYLLQTDTMTWSQPKIQGKAPSLRDKSGSVAIGNKVYIFGGFGPSLESSKSTGDPFELIKSAEFVWWDDIHVLNTETLTWETPVVTGMRPSSRCAVGMVALDDHSIFIFGGRDTKQRTNDLHKLTIAADGSLSWSAINPVGVKPGERSFHSCVPCASKLVVFGGLSGANSHYNDIHIYDSSTNAWVQPPLEGAVQARGFHSAVVVNNSMILFGGSSHYDPIISAATVYYQDLYTMDLLPVRNVTIVVPATPTKDETKNNIQGTATNS